MIRRVEYNEIGDCIEISNGKARLVVPVSIGPRVLFYGFDDGESVFGWHPAAAVETELGTWKPYGGHRLWVAPENMPLSYAPDSEPVDHGTDGELSARLMQAASERTAFEKEMTVTLDASGSGVTVDHRITNRGEHRVEISAWALSIMRPGGTVVIPNEPFAPYGPDALLPVRSMALWSYTDLTDPRWSFERESIRLRVDESVQGQQKIGVSNRRGFVRYELPDVTFTKSAAWSADANYPDMNSNFEVYTDGGFVEIESLSPLKHLEPDQSVTHRERWELTAN
jgi:hypothetical protein